MKWILSRFESNIFSPSILTAPCLISLNASEVLGTILASLSTLAIVIDFSSRFIVISFISEGIFPYWNLDWNSSLALFPEPSPWNLFTISSASKNFISRGFEPSFCDFFISVISSSSLKLSNSKYLHINTSEIEQFIENQQWLQL